MLINLPGIASGFNFPVAKIKNRILCFIQKIILPNIISRKLSDA
jgi:hypothetical protein